jgi:transcriptional regulator with XRE-family HTH domain
MKNRDNDRAFVEALRSILKQQGFGAQTELAAKAGVSKSHINDILKGRSFGKVKTHQALAEALGYADLESFLELGIQIIRENQLQTVLPADAGSLLDSGRMPTMLEILIENRNLRLQMEKMKKELELAQKNVLDPAGQ